MAIIAEIKQKFHSINGFPNVIGAIDCTHIPIKAPKENEAFYVNRKHYHSVNIQVVANSQQFIMSVCARYPGSTHDAFIWRNSHIRQRFVTGEFGDSYLLGKYLC